MASSTATGIWPLELLRDGWRQHWRYFQLALGIFAISCLIGALLVDRIDLFAQLGIDNLDEVFPDEITTTVLLVNNSIVFLLAVIGVLSFGVLTGLVLVINGILLGYVVTPVALEESAGFAFLAIAPHGVFELTAFFMASAVAFRLLHRFVGRVRGHRSRLLDPGDRGRIAMYLGTGWILLALAAVIEAHLTLWLLETVYPELAPSA